MRLSTGPTPHVRLGRICKSGSRRMPSAWHASDEATKNRKSFTIHQGVKKFVRENRVLWVLHSDSESWNWISASTLPKEALSFWRSVFSRKRWKGQHGNTQHFHQTSIRKKELVTLSRSIYACTVHTHKQTHTNVIRKTDMIENFTILPKGMIRGRFMSQCTSIKMLCSNELIGSGWSRSFDHTKKWRTITHVLTTREDQTSFIIISEFMNRLQSTQWQNSKIINSKKKRHSMWKKKKQLNYVL